MTRNPRAVMSTAVVTATALVVGTLAALYDGYTTADLDLNDGGVWVSGATSIGQLAGHLNYPSQVLDGAALVDGAFELFQDGEEVLAYRPSSGQLVPISAVTVSTTPGGSASPTSTVDFRAGTLAIVDAGNHGLYTASLADVQGGWGPVGRDPVATLGEGADVAVGVDGATYAVSVVQPGITTVPPTGGEPTTGPLAPVSPRAKLAITAVGDIPVVLDTGTGTLYVQGRQIQVPDGVDGILQAPGAANDRVAIATRVGLVMQPLDGTAPSVTPVPEGEPTQPLWVNGCAYAVWSVTGQYTRDCVGEADDVAPRTVPGAGDQSRFALRHNRGAVVLNDLQTGQVWLVDEDMAMMQNRWEDVVPPREEDAEEEEEEDEQAYYVLPPREENEPPIAEPDERGVRAGQTTVLPVLENDTDPNGDPLRADLAGEPPAGFVVRPIRGGAALQVAVPETATGRHTFTYGVSDGFDDGTSEAQVTLDVKPETINTPPVVQPTTLNVEVGALVRYDVLQKTKDAEGDDFFLLDAWSDEGDQVTFRPSGIVEFRTTGPEGRHVVKLKVSDGRGGQPGEGELILQVNPRDTRAPIANSDRYTATVNVPITVEPLANDFQPGREALHLNEASVAPTGPTVEPNYPTGTFSFVSSKPGTYYVTYLVTAGPFPANGLVRIDVEPGGDSQSVPVAARDVALLPDDGEVLADVLANDSDPGGGILVVQNVTSEGPELSAEVLEHRILRIRDVNGLSAPATIRYQISNGSQTDVGEVRVLPIGSPEGAGELVAVDDEVTVRAGDVATVDVLANDYHTGGRPFVLGGLETTPPLAAGTLFVAQDKLRFRAGDEAQTVQVTYRLKDATGDDWVSGRLKLRILDVDTTTNQAPQSVPAIARVVAGSSVRIPIVLDGIDPNGDSVQLTGITTPPGKGRVSVGDSWLTYEADPAATGADRFEYEVTDRLGLTARGSVQVGVARPSGSNQPPSTRVDPVKVKPGRGVAVPVLQNDFDPDGDPLRLVGGDHLVAPAGLEVIAERDRVLVPGSEAGEYTISYGATDGRSEPVDGSLSLVVSEAAEESPPIARDDRVDPRSVGTEPTIEVAVLENDEDPDGVVADLQLTSDDAEPLTNGLLRITLTEDPQVVMYTVTDPDQKQGSAFVFVPGTASLRPTVTTTEPIEVKSGEPVTLALADHIRVRQGRVPRVAVAEAIAVQHGTVGEGKEKVADPFAVIYTSSAKYYGPDTVSLLVTDGEGPDDPDGVSAYVSIPLLVVPAGNVPPSLAETTIEVGPDGGDAMLDLRTMASDPNPGDLDTLSFRIVDTPEFATAELTPEGQLSVRPRSGDVPPGTEGALLVEVRDQQEAAVQPGRVNLVMVRSREPLPIANDDVRGEAAQGRTEIVDVLRNDVNPFPEPPLVIVGTEVRRGEIKGEVGVDGPNIVVTPADDFLGELVVTYWVQDATLSTERQAQADLTLLVYGAPDAPDRPSVEAAEDGSVVLSWRPPDDNGRRITGYVVRDTGRGFEQECNATTCTIEGLKNNTEYAFQVVAVNEIGESAPSPAVQARPDARPKTPAAPTLAFGDRELTVTWKTPKVPNSGSKVVDFDLEITPGPERGLLRKPKVTGNSLVWENLANGKAYQVRIRARNNAPEPSEWSDWSAPEIPAAPPDPPGRPTTEPAVPVGNQVQIRVEWAAPAENNGDAVSSYTLYADQGGKQVGKYEVSTNSHNLVVNPSTSDYTFTVTATNKAGEGSASDASTPRRPAGAPPAPAGLALTPGDERIEVRFDVPSDLRGHRSNELTWRYRLEPGGTGTLPAGGGTVSGLRNGEAYSVEVWASSSVPGTPVGASVREEATPFGKPIISNLRAESLDNAVRFTWSVDPNGRPITESSHSGGSYTRSGLAAGETYTLNLAFTNEAGPSRASIEGRARVPAPSATVSKGASAQGQPGCASAACRYLVVNTSNFPAGTYNYRCRASNVDPSTDPSAFSRVYSRNFPANDSVQLACLYGYPGRQVWVEIHGVVETSRFTW